MQISPTAPVQHHPHVSLSTTSVNIHMRITASTYRYISHASYDVFCFFITNIVQSAKSLSEKEEQTVPKSEYHRIGEEEEEERQY